MIAPVLKQQHNLYTEIKTCKKEEAGISNTKNTFPLKRGILRKRLKRISPFLLFNITSIVALPCMFIEHSTSFKSIRSLLLFLTFLAPNLLLVDFALYNYFNGKKIALIWLIELLLCFGIIYYII